MKKYAIVDISTKKKIICHTESINMWIWADEAYHLTDFSNIMSYWRHNDFTFDIWFQIWDQSIKFSIYAEFQLKMYEQRYCNVTQKERVIFRPSA